MIGLFLEKEPEEVALEIIGFQQLSENPLDKSVHDFVYFFRTEVFAYLYYVVPGLDYHLRVVLIDYVEEQRDQLFYFI